MGSYDDTVPRTMLNLILSTVVQSDWAVRGEGWEYLISYSAISLIFTHSNMLCSLLILGESTFIITNCSEENIFFLFRVCKRRCSYTFTWIWIVVVYIIWNPKFVLLSWADGIFVWDYLLGWTQVNFWAKMHKYFISLGDPSISYSVYPMR